MNKEKKSNSHKSNNYNFITPEKLDKQTIFSQKKQSFSESPDLKKLKQKYEHRASNSLRKKSDQSPKRQNSRRYSSDLDKQYTIDTVNLKKINKDIQNESLKLPSINKRLNQYETIKLREVQNKKPRNYSFDITISQDAQKVKREKVKNQKKQYPISIRTKAGSNGNVIKINQDLDIVCQKLPFGIKLFCICDGHGTNGHLVAAFIRKKLLQNIRATLAGLKQIEYLQQQLYLAILRTNTLLLQSDINTELSGSTLVAVVIHEDRILCFNVGDSRAILVDYYKYGGWKTVQISNDHKPERKDEAKRILAAGGRIEQQTNEKKQYVGPLRVWMKDVHSPGLAMTRSFGDKAGNKAGTIAQPQVTQFVINPHNKYLVIASDGIWQHLQNHEVVKFIEHELKEQSIEEAADILLKACVDIWSDVCNSRDDITFMIVKINPIDTGQNEQQ